MKTDLTRTMSLKKKKDWRQEKQKIWSLDIGFGEMNADYDVKQKRY